jgi:hypothetical protein
MTKNATSETPPRHAPIALWQAAHAIIIALFNLFGAPEDIGAQSTLTKHARNLLLLWLRAAEAVVRRLIFIEASKLSADGPPPSKRLAGKTPAAQKSDSPPFFTNDPDSWRVSFRCSVPDRRRSRGRNSSRRAPRQILARPLLSAAKRSCAPLTIPRRSRSAWRAASTSPASNASTTSRRRTHATSTAAIVTTISISTIAPLSAASTQADAPVKPASLHRRRKLRCTHIRDR